MPCALSHGDAVKSEVLVSQFDAPPQFAFLGWEKKVEAVKGGVRVNAPNAQGGAGFVFNTDLSAFADRTPALTLTVNPANRARTLHLVFQDTDDTEYDYTLKLDSIAPGATGTITADDGASLKEPGKVGKPGSREGLDLAHLRYLLIIGDWTPVPTDVTLRRIELIEPTAAILAQREKLRQRLAAEAEQRRKADAAKATRIAELLKGAPHPADGPDIRHVAAVAPDVLAVSVQEKQFLAVAQVPYEPKEGDEIRREGKEKLLVVEDGKLQESPIGIAVFRGQGANKTKIGNLAINANRIKADDKATGQDLSDETVADPKAYRIAAIDDPTWAAPAAPLAVSWKRKPNAFRSMTHQVEIYLKLPRPLTEGAAYRIEFPGVNLRQATIDYRHEPLKVRSPAVHVSAIGFRPDDPFKRAFLSVWLGTGGAQHYADNLKSQILDDATGKSVFTAPVKLLIAAEAKESFKAGRNYCKTDVLGMDFGGFNTPGRYRVCVEGIGCSYPFEIGPDVWMRAFQLSMKGLLHHRSGIDLGPPFTDYRRPRNMHPADGVKVFASAASELEGAGQDGIFEMLAKNRTDRLLPDAWGGHMDAGDWDRNTAHPAAMWSLVDLYEMFPGQIGSVKLALPAGEASNAIPDILDEVLWNLDLYRQLQAPDGGVGGGIESTSHPRPGEASWQESLMLSAYAPDPRLVHLCRIGRQTRAESHRLRQGSGGHLRRIGTQGLGLGGPQRRRVREDEDRRPAPAGRDCGPAQSPKSRRIRVVAPHRRSGISRRVRRYDCAASQQRQPDGTAQGRHLLRPPSRRAGRRRPPCRRPQMDHRIRRHIAGVRRWQRFRPHDVHSSAPTHGLHRLLLHP